MTSSCHGNEDIIPYITRHLARSYGDRAPLVIQLASSSTAPHGGSGVLGRRLVPGHPVIAAEVVYAARHEFCQTVCDFIARRTRLAFLDAAAAEAALPEVGREVHDMSHPHIYDRPTT